MKHGYQAALPALPKHVLSRKNSLRKSQEEEFINNNYPVHRLPSVVERFMRESLQSTDFKKCKVLEATEPSLLDQHMAAIGMDEFEQFFDRDCASKKETENEIYRNEIYKKNDENILCSSDSDSMMVRECKHRKPVQSALENRSRQPSPVSSEYSEKSEVGSRDLILLAQWSEEYGEHIATKMLGTLITMRDRCKEEQTVC